MTVCILDGRGGGMGAAMAERLRGLPEGCRLLCLGTNPFAAQRMAEASGGVAVSAPDEVLAALADADILLGTAGILNAGALKGELSAEAAAAVARSPAKKFILPMNRCGLYVAGVADRPAAELIAELCNTVWAEITAAQKRGCPEV